MAYRVAFYTLGCKVNQYDTQTLKEDFAARGCEIVNFAAVADAYIINTCTVTQTADAKGRKVISAARHRNPQAVVAVCGCYAEAAREEVQRLPGVAVVVGTHDRARLPDLVLAELQRRQTAPQSALLPSQGEVQSIYPRPRALLKVQDGCNHVCSFCIVPRVRGRQRSRPLPEVVAEARRRVAHGARELVLTGVRLGAYGQDWPERRSSRFQPLIDLLYALHEIENLARLRLSSLLPLDVSPRLLEAMAALPKVCPHLHLPLQSGDEEVLRRMRRGYRPARFAEIVEQARTLMPDLALTTDVLVGFPGETEEQFQHTYDFCRRMRFSRMHIFKYSPRPGTEAAALPDQIPPAEKERRSRSLHALRDELALAFHQQFVGRRVEVLMETVADGWARGLTPHYVRVLVPHAEPNTFVRVRVTEAETTGVRGIVE
ncbi:MAG TPA: tRNA (N(6)-L-threonylcarbamoyladenosine(37)-C(2))-methylthiotransferase MtaB [Armatimonadetes bacterium]|nr:tRNA (N(6)-L-threonylcarbamoyladenosine(37)-C(2))-methylthiotransferase MtaB [Armatimonadota bacterium]